MIELRVKKLNNTLQKTIGLLGKTEPESVFFTTRFGIHTFGMKFPIDVVILNKQNQVVTIKENLQPKRIFLWNPKYNNVVELPNGTINKYKIQKYIKIALIF